MLKRPTLLVIGAGASKEANLPVGRELAIKIAGLLNYHYEMGKRISGNEDFLEALRRKCANNAALTAHIKICQKIAGGIRHVNSIDNYIDTHRHEALVAECGKLAIVYSILEEERNSYLYLPSRRQQLDIDQLENTWYVPFGRMLIDRVPFEDVEKVFSNLTIICFNYDRCVEQFLIHWLIAVYGVDLSTASRLVEAIPILRPYGSVGKLATVPFGNEWEYSNIIEHSKEIKTYSEQIADQELISAIKSAMTEAETVVFLGFRFHSQNMSLLNPGAPCKASRLLASAFGISAPDLESIQSGLRKLMWPDGPKNRVAAGIQFHVRNDLKCGPVFEEYGLLIQGD